MLLGDKLTEPNLPDDSADAALPTAEGLILYGRFLVLRDLTDPTLGGGFSSYLVKDLKNFCSEVIFKTIPPGLKEVTGGPSFQEVCGVIIRLAHRSIEEILETGALFDGGRYAVARKYPGVRLTEVIGEDNRLELVRIAAIVEQIADALAAARAKNVLHCDVSPGNVLLIFGGDGHESVRLMNFGAAWPVDARGEAMEKLLRGSGSFAYAAPELHTKLGHRSPASDVYSLGVLAYRLITGRLPFKDGDRANLLEAINSGQIDPPTEGRTDLSNETGKLLLSALQFEPALRPADVEDFGTRLASSLRTGPRIQPGSIYAFQETKPVETPAPEFAADEPSVVEPAAAARIEPRPVRKVSKPGPTVSERVAAWALILLLLAGALSIPIAQTLLAEERTVTPGVPLQPTQAADIPRQQVKYWFAQPKQSQDKGTLLHPDRQLFLSSDAPGQLFVFREVADAEGRTSYKLNFAAGPVEPEKAVGTGAGAPADGEQLWVVWAPPNSADLAEFRNAADAQGLIAGNDARRLRHFLERNRNLHVATTQDALTGQTVVTGSGDRIVHRVEAAQN